MNNKTEHKFKAKVFQARNSPLIDLFENAHVRTVYHLFLALFIGLFLSSAVNDCLIGGEVVPGLKLIKPGFAKIEVAVLLWLGYFALTCASYFLFKIWAQKRNYFGGKSRQLWDVLWISTILLYYAFSFISCGHLVTKLPIAVGTTAFLIGEQTRLLMKIHSFIRENVPKILDKSKSDDKHFFPKFSSFLYFLFAPTLVYRDAYPKRPTTNWSYVGYRFLECIGCVFFLSFVSDRFVQSPLREFGLRRFAVTEIVLCMFENSVWGVLILLTLFFLLLHSWLNMFAEITRFDDRLFYLDWWTCTSYSEWFRKWNVVVHDWLFLYIYKDFARHVFIGSTVLPKFATFFISALAHEWILVHLLGFFFPLLFFEFLIFGSLLHFLPTPKTNFANVLFLYGLSLGMGTLVTMYTVEFYARKNAPLFNPTLRDTLIPRFLTCDCIEFG